MTACAEKHLLLLKVKPSERKDSNVLLQSYAQVCLLYNRHHCMQSIRRPPAVKKGHREYFIQDILEADVIHTCASFSMSGSVNKGCIFILAQCIKSISLKLRR